MPLLCGRVVCCQRGKTMTLEKGGGMGEGEMDPRCAVTNYITSEWSALISIRVHFHRRETLHHEPDPPLSPPAFAAHHAAKQAGRQAGRRAD